MSKEPSITFEEFVRVINEVLVGADEVCKTMWERHCKECTLRQEPKDSAHGDVVQCRYPEHINYVNVDNCKYEWCPLIKRRGDHDV
jgi:hypothetical protein